MSARRRYVTFARSLALVSGATTIGCDGGGVLFPPDATDDAKTDSAFDATLDVHDAPADAGDAPLPPGACRVVALDAARDLECPAGFTCSYPDDASVRCTYGMDAAGDGGENQECGTILCGEYCYCIGPAANVCGCFQGPTGPLSPPDLPRDIIEQHGRPEVPPLRARADARLRHRRGRV